MEFINRLLFLYINVLKNYFVFVFGIQHFFSCFMPFIYFVSSRVINITLNQQIVLHYKQCSMFQFVVFLIKKIVKKKEKSHRNIVLFLSFQFVP